MKKQLVGFGVVLGAFVAMAGAQQAQAATTGQTEVTLQVQDFASVTASPTATIIPTLDDIMANEVTDADAIELTIDSTSGAKVTWEGDGSDGTSNTIKDSDITLSSDGSTFVAGDGTTALYTSTDAQQGDVVPIAVKISNLKNYDRGNHTNTVTFTIVAN